MRISTRSCRTFSARGSGTLSNAAMKSCTAGPPAEEPSQESTIRDFASVISSSHMRIPWGHGGHGKVASVTDQVLQWLQESLHCGRIQSGAIFLPSSTPGVYGCTCSCLSFLLLPDLGGPGSRSRSPAGPYPLSSDGLDIGDRLGSRANGRSGSRRRGHWERWSRTTAPLGTPQPPRKQ
jgi:hypothetical protein